MMPRMTNYVVTSMTFFLKDRGFPPAPTFIKKQRRNQHDQDNVQHSATTKVAVTKGQSELPLLQGRKDDHGQRLKH